MIMRFLIALDVFLCHLLTGQNDMTISGYSYILHRQGKSTPMKLIDWLFRVIRGQQNHCKETFEWEMQQSREMLSDYGQYLDEFDTIGK